MSKFKEFKQKVKDNKGKIITGFIFIGGVTYVIVTKNNTIKELQLNDIRQQEDIEILKSVMNDGVLTSLKETLSRKLRYHEGRLNNGLKDGVMTKADEMKRREEIDFINQQLEKIFKAEELLANSGKRD